MKVPGAKDAVVDLAKLRDYCLNLAHPRGRHKARVFASVLGLNQAHAEELRAALLCAVRTAPAATRGADLYGTRYMVDFEFSSRGRTATIRSVWIVLAGEVAPRLTTCFVL